MSVAADPGSSPPPPLEAGGASVALASSPPSVGSHSPRSGPSSSQPTQAWLRAVLSGQFSLPGLLCVAALAEFFLYRLLQPLLRLAPGILPLWLWGSLDAAGTWSLHFASVLSLIVTITVLVQTISPQGLSPNPVGRLGLTLMTAVFSSISVGLLLFPGTVAAALGMVRAQWLAQTSSVCVALLALLSLLPQRTARRRHKVGMLLLLIPPLILLDTQWGLITSHGILAPYSLMVVIYGTTMAAVALGGAALCMAPLRERTKRPDQVALTVALGTVAGMTALLLLDRGAVARLVYIGFDMHLPAAPLAQLLYLASLGSWLFAVVTLLLRSSHYHRRGIGLLLVGLAGGQPRTIYQQCFFLTGLLCLADSLRHGDERSDGAPGPTVA